MASTSKIDVVEVKEVRTKEFLTGVSTVTLTKATTSNYSMKSEKKSRPTGKILCGGLLAVVLIGGLVGTIVYYNLQPTLREFQWWHKTTIYQIYPRSFQDTNGDGLGDLNGITQRLPYLKKLGIETIWLSPFFKSPMADFGYDVADFKEVDPIFGTMADFEALMKEVKELKLRLVLDFVPNHTSNESEWFQGSVANLTAYRDYYVWHSGHPVRTVLGPNNETIPAPPNNWMSVFGGSSWEWNTKRQQYYLHQFLAAQPDLNWRNPRVQREMDSVFHFWLDKGVDGFRIDAIPFLFEVPIEEMVDANETRRNPWWPEVTDPADYEYWLHPYSRNMPQTVQQVRNWTRLMTDYVAKNGGDSKFLILEVVDRNLTVVKEYYPDDPFGTAAMPFYMGLTNLNNETNGFDIDRLVRDNLDMLPKGAWPNWVIGNHDQSRATGKMGNPEFIDGLNMLNLLLPGIPTTYYGEEIGMLNTIIANKSQVRDPGALHPSFDAIWRLKTRDYCRSPMQWNTSVSAGFSSNTNTWLPLAPQWDDTLNVEYQNKTENGSTHYSVFKDLLRIRRTPTFQSGRMRHALISADIYSFIRENDENSFLICVDLRRNSKNEDEKQFYDFTKLKLKEKKGKIVTGSVNLLSKKNSLVFFQKGDEIFLDKVPLIPASALVLRLTRD